MIIATLCRHSPVWPNSIIMRSLKTRQTDGGDEGGDSVSCTLYYSAIGMMHNRRLWHDNKTNYNDKQNNVSCQQSQKT